MNLFAKQCAAALLNGVLLTTQIHAQLPRITFELEWQPYQSVGQDPASGWNLLAGNAFVSPEGSGIGGGKALCIPASAGNEAQIIRAIDWLPSETTAFIDFQVKPAANPVGSLASIYAAGTQMAFQIPEGSQAGEIWVYQGNDGTSQAAPEPEEWIRTAGTFHVPSGATAANQYVRVTMRHDYSRNIWDLFIDGKLAASNLSFEGRTGLLDSISFYGSLVGDTLVDDLSAETQNMLFPDADKDGLPDAWEIANGSNPNLYDRDSINPATGRSYLDDYMGSLWPAGGANGLGTLPSSLGTPPLSIPPLSIDSEAPHQAVGALKGSLSVGGDGSSNYSIPIDLPKGTAGMEPKLSLSYSSGGGNGILGLGWNLAGLQRITRGPSSSVKDGSFDPMDFDASDRFFLDGERLVCVAGTYGAAGSEYRTEIDSFARITAVGTGPDHWKVETKSGLIITLGGTLDSKVAVAQGALSWSVNKVADTTGNYYSVEYAGDVGISNQRVAAMHYTGNTTKALAPYCHVYFDYESRPDGGPAYSTYAAFTNDKRLAKIRVLTNSHVNHSYVLSYTNSYQSGRSLLTSISKRVADNPLLAIPATVFNYDGLTEGEPLWRTPAEPSLPVYGVNLDANGGGVNSFISTSATDDTVIELTGDVSRSFRLNAGDITLYSDTCIQFDFKSENQVNGSIIGLDGDVDYQTSSAQKLVRIGGTGSVVLGQTSGFNTQDINYSGPTQPYTVGQGWKTFNVPIGATGSPLMKYLVLMCVDKSATDGTENAMFRNIRIYRSGTQQPSDVQPIHFPVTSTLPVMFDSSGKDLGVISMDFDGDGLPDLTDWRARDYITTNGLMLPTTTGGMYRNTGEAFASAPSMLPPVSLPLGVRSADADASGFGKKHHLLGQPMDVNGDGKLDLLCSARIERSGSVLKNEYDVFTWNGSAWVEMQDWRLPFQLVGTPTTSQTYGTLRDEHFQWTDLNLDGYPDLLVHTRPHGRLYNSGLQQTILGGGPQAEIAGGSTSVAFLNKGKNGPGWIRDDSYALPVPLMVDQKDQGRRLLDLDGDGLLESHESCPGEVYDEEGYPVGIAPGTVYRLQPAANPRWNLVQDPFSLPTPPTLSNNGTSGLLIADLNGDGLVDCFKSTFQNGISSKGTWMNSGRVTASPWNLLPATPVQGYPFGNYDFPFPLHYYDNAKFNSYGFEMADLNGDGLTDVLYSGLENTATPGVDNLASLNNGNGWTQRTAWGLPGTNRIFTSSSNRDNERRSARLQDINGDGFPDLLTDLLGTTPRVWYNNCRPEVLKSVTDGFGSDLQVDYHRLNDPTPTPGFGSRVYQKWTDSMSPGHNAVIDARLVVSSYSEPDGNGGRRVRSQRYGDLRYDRVNDASLGFGWVEAKDHLNNQTTRTETHRNYPFAGSPVWTRTWVEVKPSDLSSAMPGVTAGTKCLSEETATYAEMPSQVGVAGGTIRRPVQTSSVKTLCDLKENILSRTTTAQNLTNFDDFGFIIRSTVTYLDGTVVISSSNYTHTVDPTRWHLGRLASSTVSKTGGDTKASSFTYHPTTGLLVSETIQPGHALSVTKTYTHDDFGNVISTAVTGSSQTRIGTSTYDTQGRFVLSEKNALNHTTSYSYDFNRALLSSTTGISGKTAYFSYDPFGTLVRTYLPDGTQTGESTGFATTNQLPAAVAAQVANPIKYFRAKQSSGSPVGKVYLDALGREIVSETTILRDATATNTARYSKVYTVSGYDAWGRKTRVTEPFGSGDTPLATTINYDILSRVTRTTHPDGSADVLQEASTLVSSTNPVTYSRVTNARSGVLERWENQHGRLVQSRDSTGLATIFARDVEGRLVTATVGGTLLLTNAFDLMGNKTSVTEANSGTSTSTFNAFGEVLTTTNARTQTASFTYDILGRVLTVAKPEGTYTTTYDGASGDGLGKPWKTTGPDGYEDVIAYDSLGRPRTSTKTQFGETHTSTTSYDALGRVFTETDAGGLTVVHSYDPAYSFPTALHIGPGQQGAGTLLWQAGTFDSKGRALTQTLAQNVASAATYQQATGLLATLSAQQPGNPLQNKAYTWDVLGNLTSRTDSLAARTESFTYDAHNRVTGSSVVALPGATITTVPPPAAYTYAITGNLLTKPGADLTYGNAASPHRVTAATIKGAARTYAYDAAGFVTSDSKRTYNWTSFGQLKSLDYASAPALQDLAGSPIFAPARVETNFSFDAGGNRARQIKQRINANDSRILEETLYLGAYEREIHSTKASAAAPPVVTKTVHRHSIGGFAVYTRTQGSTETNTRLATILKDHLGSTDLILTGTWNGSSFANPQTERQSFDPWGERRAADTQVTYRSADTDAFHTSAQDYDRGYTGHEQLDDSGLVHMNGRLYDPELGRMLSPDPFVQVPEYSQNFNRYSYVLNNPLNLTDPTGYSWISKTFHKIGSWFKENWRTVVSIVFFAVSFWAIGAAFYAAFHATLYAGIQGGIAGALTGAFSAAISGGDILKGAISGGITGAVGGALGGYGTVIKGLGGAVASGVGKVVMGGKFQDGFLTSIKYTAIFAAGQEVGRMASSYLSKNNINGRANIERGEGMQLNNAGYKAQRMWYDNENHYIDASKLDLPEGWEFTKYHQDPQGVSNLDYATFVNHAKGIRLMSMIGTQNDRWGVDWLDDVKQALGFPTKQYFRAIDFALKEQTITQNMGYSFVLSGHSLGGGLAAAASAVTGAPALIYNAAGVNPLTLRYAGYANFVGRLGSNVTSYSVGGEILTSGQFALSSLIPTASSNNHYIFLPRNIPWSSWSPISLHRPTPTLEAVR